MKLQVSLIAANFYKSLFNILLPIYLKLSFEKDKKRKTRVFDKTPKRVIEATMKKINI